jgi:hypothetical protein
MCTYALRYNVKYLVLIYPKLLNSSHQLTLLKSYEIKTDNGKIDLKAIQVDLFEDDLSKICNSVYFFVQPTFEQVEAN